MRHQTTVILFSSLVASACSTPQKEESSTTGLECQIQTDAQHTPGYPFDLSKFRSDVLPVLVRTCANCHAAPDGKNGFNVWLDSAPGTCNYAKTFNAFKTRVDVVNPTNSRVYLNVAGDNPAHPLQLGKEHPEVKLLLQFIQDASRTLAGLPPVMGGGGGGTPGSGNGGGVGGGAPTSPPPPNASPFDYAVFEAQIMPILDSAEMKGCSAGACHGSPTGQAGFKLTRAAAAGSVEMKANFEAVTARADLAKPDSSKIYLRATNRHAGGASAVVSAAQASTILDFITRAQAAAPPTAPGSGQPPTANCASVNNFNAGVFRDEILPVLLGTVDLNDPTETRVTTGCARAACHGQDRTGGALVLKTTASVDENLANFSCFVNLTSPTSSEILLCPLNTPGCRRSPHPGQEVFGGVDDRNYQRILSYLYAAKTVASPLDFAFFARRINPLFNDINAVAAGTNRTCADGNCHGISVAAQPAPNGSNFPIISNASDKQRILFNFASAANFTNFVDARGSSLFLYPTNEIANLANPFATGLPHPGGLDFAPDSVQALDMLRWSGGLRPDGEGRQLDWLVAGDYPALVISDTTVIEESSVEPSLFDRSGAPQFNNGEWDGLFSDNGIVDLNQSFPREATSGRVAYAVAYFINTTAVDLTAEITVVSPNAVKLWVGKNAAFQANDASSGVTALATLPAFGTSKQSTRILMKVLQRAEDRQFRFQMFLRDSFGNALTNTTGELVIKLSPDGGI